MSAERPVVCLNVLCPSYANCGRAGHDGDMVPGDSILVRFEVPYGQTQCPQYQPLPAEPERKQA